LSNLSYLITWQTCLTCQIYFLKDTSLMTHNSQKHVLRIAPPKVDKLKTYLNCPFLSYMYCIVLYCITCIASFASLITHNAQKHVLRKVSPKALKDLTN
jgi:hypothetical protein